MPPSLRVSGMLPKSHCLGGPAWNPHVSVMCYISIHVATREGMTRICIHQVMLRFADGRAARTRNATKHDAVVGPESIDKHLQVKPEHDRSDDNVRSSNNIMYTSYRLDGQRNVSTVRSPLL